MIVGSGGCGRQIVARTVLIARDSAGAEEERELGTLGAAFFALAGFSGTVLRAIPITSDFPWATLLLCAVGGILLVVGLFRAFGKPGVYRGKILDRLARRGY